MKRLLVINKIFIWIYIFILQSFFSLYLQADMIDSKEINWEKIYTLVREDKLPKLSIDEEKKIIEETDKILMETKSLHSACNFLIEKISESRKRRYLIFGNEGIKGKLVELFKMRRQCELKKAIQTDW